MKNKIQVVALILLGFAQAGNAQTVTLKGGLNMYDMFFKAPNETYSDHTKLHPGFQAGVSVDIPIKNKFSLEPSVLFSQKGFAYANKSDMFGSTVDVTMNMYLNYIDIPLVAKLKFDVAKVKMFTTLGPYLGIGLNGTLKHKAVFTFMGDTEVDEGSEKVKWGSDANNDMLKRIDYGLMAGAAVQIKAFQIGLTYGYGLANISSSPDLKIRNRVLGLTVGYSFGKQ